MTWGYFLSIYPRAAMQALKAFAAPSDFALSLLQEFMSV